MRTRANANLHLKPKGSIKQVEQSDKTMQTSVQEPEMTLLTRRFAMGLAKLDDRAVHCGRHTHIRVREGAAVM